MLSLTHSSSYIQLCANLVQDALEVDRLWSLNRQAQRPIPDQLCQWAQPTADTEGSGVVQRFLETVVVEEDT